RIKIGLFDQLSRL
uniref:Beta-pompilidotoxin n=1 Tax=Batozonellus maculifrons TaxID=308766 RepID=PMTXB_BATMC|nr:RecName: Full=Beta-pompilidotoxin; Short=Beta-PMTX [Batozonellus maculifrons]